MTTETQGNRDLDRRFVRLFLPNGRADVVFMLFVGLVMALGLLVGRSHWVADFYQSRAAEQWVIPEQQGQVTQYRMKLTCIPEMRAPDCSAQMQLEYDLPADWVGKPMAMLFRDFNGDISIWLNDRQVFQSTGRSTMLRIQPLRPLVVDLPQERLNPGVNVLRVAVQSRSALGGYIQSLWVGPRAALRPQEDMALFLSGSVPMLLGGALLPIAIVATFLGWRHREASFLLCGLVSLCFCISSLYEVLPIQTPTSVLQGIRMVRIIPAAYFGAFIHSIAGLRYPVSLRVLAFFVLGFVATWTVTQSLFQLLVVTHLFWFMTLVITLHSIASVALSGWQRKQKGGVFLVAASLFGVSILALNLISMLGSSVELRPLLRGYNSSVLVILLSLELVKRFSDRTVRLEQSNREMQEAIIETTRSLELSHARSEAQRRGLLIQSERQRLMGDLHDGLAGSLISIQALSRETDQTTLPQIQELAKRALLDLRLVVDSLDTFEGDLAAVIAAFRERIMPQYSDRAIRIHWDISRAPRLDHVSPEMSLGLFRILQEALANARRHGKPRNIWISAHAMKGQPTVALITVCDDGRPKLPVMPGFGMRNMRRRATNLGGVLRFHFGKRGTVVCLRLPGRDRGAAPGAGILPQMGARR